MFLTDTVFLSNAVRIAMDYIIIGPANPEAATTAPPSSPHGRLWFLYKSGAATGIAAYIIASSRGALLFRLPRLLGLGRDR